MWTVATHGQTRYFIGLPRPADRSWPRSIGAPKASETRRTGPLRCVLGSQMGLTHRPSCCWLVLAGPAKGVHVRFLRDVFVNLIANLVAAAIIYLVGVWVGLFPVRRE